MEHRVILALEVAVEQLLPEQQADQQTPRVLVVQVEQEQLLQFQQHQQLMLEVVAVEQGVLFQHQQVVEPLEPVVVE